MLFARPTPKGTGAEFWGDYNDLSCLYDTICKLYSFESEAQRLHGRNTHLLPIMSYEIRHALKNERLKEVSYEDEKWVTTYFGFRVDWITLLYTLSALHYNAGYKPTNEIEQSNLYQLEYWTRKTLYTYDAEGAKQIELFINARINVASKYVYQIFQYHYNAFISQEPGKKRFRSISTILSTMGSYSQELKDLINTIEKDAVIHDSNINDLEYYDEMDVIW